MWMHLLMLLAVSIGIALVIALVAYLVKGPPFKLGEFVWLVAGAWFFVMMIGGLLYLGRVVFAINSL